MSTFDASSSKFDWTPLVYNTPTGITCSHDRWQLLSWLSHWAISAICLVGASVSEPHTSELNGEILWYIYIYIYICMYICIVRRTCTSNACVCVPHAGQKACDLTTRVNQDTFWSLELFRVVLLLVVNTDTPNTSTRALKPSEDKEVSCRLRRRREQERLDVHTFLHQQSNYYQFNCF